MDPKNNTEVLVSIQQYEQELKEKYWSLNELKELGKMLTQF